MEMFLSVRVASLSVSFGRSAPVCSPVDSKDRCVSLLEAFPTIQGKGVKICTDLHIL